MVKERILAVPYTTVFIAQLPKETQDIIREDMKLHARENGYRLEWDAEARDYIGMTRRFCDIEEIYALRKWIFVNRVRISNHMKEASSGTLF